MKNYYQILGINQNASEKEIRNAFLTLSKKYHPDVNPDKKDGEAKFKEINEAYSTLNNIVKRKNYDSKLKDSLSAQNFKDPRYTWDDIVSGRKKKNPFRSYDNYQEENREHKRRTGRYKWEKNIPKGKDVHITLEVPFSELENAQYGKVRFDREIVCDLCEGSGKDPLFTRKVCKECKGSGFVVKNVAEGFHYPSVRQSGMQIKEFEKGHHSKEGGRPGDLYVTVVSKIHPDVRIEGDKLAYTLVLSILDLITGGSFSVPCPIGGTLRFKLNPGFEPGKSILFKADEGAKYFFGKREYQIKIKVKYPEKLTKAQLETLEKLKKHKNFKV